MEELAEVAGYFAAHGIWSVASGGPLIPFVGLKHEGDEGKLVRFVDAGKLERAVEKARELLESNDEGARFGTLVYDAYVTLPEGKTDALILESRCYPEPTLRLTMAVPYRHPAHADGFAVHRPKFLGFEGPAAVDYQALSKAFFAGVDAHAEGAALWSQHLDQSR